MIKYCKCGCGEIIIIKLHHKYIGIPDYIHGHNRKNMKHTDESILLMSEVKMGHLVSDETRSAMSKMKLGISQTPKHRNALSKAHEKSDIMRGGNDIIWHHTLYDHDDLLKHRVSMTRRNHTMGIMYLRNLE